MLEKLSGLISYIFHPIFIPLYTLILVLHSGIYGNNIPLPVLKLVYLIVALFSILLPASFLLGLHFLKIIKTLTLDEKRERFLPLFFGTISLFFTYYFIHKLGSMSFLSSCFFAIAVSSVVCLLISVFWKISLHMIGMGGFIAFVAYIYISYQIDLFYLLIGAIGLSGILGTSRLFLKAHVPSQIYTGFFTGFMVVSLSLIFQAVQ